MKNSVTSIGLALSMATADYTVAQDMRYSPNTNSIVYNKNIQDYTQGRIDFVLNLRPFVEKKQQATSTKEFRENIQRAVKELLPTDIDYRELDTTWINYDVLYYDFPVTHIGNTYFRKDELKFFVGAMRMDPDKELALPNKYTKEIILTIGLEMPL